MADDAPDYRFALAPPEQRRYTYNGQPSNPQQFTEIFRAAGFPMMTDRELLERHHERLASLLGIEHPNVWTISEMLDELERRLKGQG